MIELTVNEMLDMQRALQEKYKDKWEPICPEVGQNKLLWMIGEIGEVADIIKKNGYDEAINDPSLRAHLVEEMADVLMYYHDVMLCYNITSDELRKAYTEKFERNMKRW
jgi:NTP pyrophosphatase (non-canonical NTP hydrolase)